MRRPHLVRDSEPPCQSQREARQDTDFESLQVKEPDACRADEFYNIIPALPRRRRVEQTQQLQFFLRWQEGRFK